MLQIPIRSNALTIIHHVLFWPRIETHPEQITLSPSVEPLRISYCMGSFITFNFISIWQFYDLDNDVATMGKT